MRYLDVRAQDAATTLVFSGSAEADEAADISFKVPGTLRNRPVSVGDKVSGGDLLGELDSRDFSVAVREAEAQLTRAKAELRNAESNYDRNRELYENDNVSKRELDAARASAESAQAQVAVARQSLKNKRLQLSYTRIVAHDDCEVARTFVKENENVNSGQAIVRLNCGACPSVRVSVPETQIGAISVGDPVTVAFGAVSDETFNAIVDEVGVAMQTDSSAFNVLVKLTENCQRIRAGMAADVAFQLDSQRHTNYISVPWVAVGEDRDGRYVYVLEAEDAVHAIARRRPIQIAETTASGIVVESGLTPGERIVTAGVRRISDGMRVKLYSKRF